MIYELDEFVFQKNKNEGDGFGHGESLGGPVTMAACGGLHSAAVTQDGALFAWGDGGRGALGLGDESRRQSPGRVAFPPGDDEATAVVCVAAGESHCVCCTETGAVYCWGDNTYGQGGHGDCEGRLVPTRVALEAPILLVSAGRYHTAAVSTQGELWIW